MLIKTGKKRNDTCVTIHAEQISLGESFISITDAQHMKLRLLYSEIIVAYLEVPEGDTGRCYVPEITELSEDMEGCLVLYDRQYSRFEIYMEEEGVTGGYILKQLALHAPYIFLGYEPWLDEHDEKEFAEIKKMVSVMQAFSVEDMSWNSL